MSTPQDSIRVTAGRPVGTGSDRPPARRAVPTLPVPSEALVLAAFTALILIATAVSDTLQDTTAWTLVTALGFAYIVSRGLAKRDGHRNGF